MSAQVINFSEHPNGRRYTPVDREAAYMHWKTISGRSLRKTAESLDISASTLGTWHTEEGWKKRAADDDREDIQSMHGGIRMRSMGGMDKNFETMEAIRDDKTAANRDRIEAVKWLAGVAGVAPVSKVEQAFINQPYPGSETEEPPDFESMTTEQLRDYEARITRKRRAV